MPQPKDKDWLYGYKIKTPIYVVSEKAMAPHSSTLPGKSHGRRSLVGCSHAKGWTGWTRLIDFTFTFHFHALEKEMATHSSVLAWRIPGTGVPGGLPFMGSHRVGRDWSDLALLVLLSFGLHLHGISFSRPSLSVCMCPLVWGGYLGIYRGLIFVSSQS